jgi:DNA-binding SARP family transcriptional activator/tetratricopeptide (TPR) repeat protein
MPTTPADERLRFLILGSLEVWWCGERVQLGGRHQERVLVTLLLEANRVVPLRRLIEAAWDEEPPATAVHQIRKLMSELRRRLPTGPETLVTDGPGYRTVVAEGQLDLMEFTRHLGQARRAEAAGDERGAVEHLQTALNLWRGPVMAGDGGTVVTSASTVLHERRLQTAESLMELRLKLGEAREVLDQLRALVLEYPLRETLRGRLILALYHTGRRAEALAEYDSIRRTLAEELGLDPGPELSALHQRVLRDSPELRRTAPEPRQPAASAPVSALPPRSLPYDLPDFTGRDGEMARILAAAAPGRSALRLIAIDGMGGSGKTALAVHAAHCLAPQYPDGQMFVDMRGFTANHEPLEPAEALDVLLRTLGVPDEQIPDGLMERSALWRMATGERKLLILLDNVRNAADVQRLLPSGPGSLILMTGRTRMTSLDGAVTLSLDLLSSEDALDLLAGVIGQARVEAEPDAARALVGLCGQLPLAVRIAAARLDNRPQWSILTMVDRLRDQAARLDQLDLCDRSVATMIGLSYDTLPRDRQNCFRLLGVHPGVEFEVHAVAALTAMPQARVEMILEDLLDARLLTQHTESRYQFHELVRSYAGTLALALENEKERQTAVRHLLEYYLDTVDRAAEILQPGRQRVELEPVYRGGSEPGISDPVSALSWLDREYPNIQSALHHARQHGMDRYTAYLPRSLTHYLQLRGRVEELIELLTAAVAASRRLGDPVFERLNLMNLAAPYWHLGRPWDVLEHLERALELATATGDQRGRAECLGRIGVQNNEVGRYADALGHHGEALDIYRKLGSHRGECATLINLSSTQGTLGRHAEALDSALRAMALSQELGDMDAELLAHVNQANSRAALDDLEQALGCLGRAYELAQLTGALDGQAVVLMRYAGVYLKAARLEEAVAAGLEALDISGRIRRPSITATIENILGTVHRERGEYEAALERYANARATAERIGLRIELARALEGSGHCLAGLGRDDEAMTRWSAALNHYEEMGTPEARLLREALGSRG